ncbi:MAG: hypothetical protein A2Y33_09625 [Spirochaetes bacterium GWF1_51_8]|nr:MAG: hypothetical protein A2Y33_09625 [Spirochaetes bacterium GWF1_51_8]
MARFLTMIGLCFLLTAACGNKPVSGNYPVPDDYPAVTNTGTTYYVDSSAGSDTNNGLAPETAWKTAAKVNAAVFGAGDRILFAKGGIWRERIIPQSGTKDGWLYYGAYGAGAKPLFLGSVEMNDSGSWQLISNQIWKWNAALSEDAGNLIFNSEASAGVKKWTYASMSAQGDFYYEKGGGWLYLVSASNPALFYTDIECALGQHMIYRPNPTYPHMGAHGISNVIFDGLAFSYGGAGALRFQGVHHIRIADCDIMWMGGAEVDGQPQTRYGNGIDFFGIAYYCQAYRNKISYMYDSGISYQSINSPAAGVGLVFASNIISNCGYAGYELWLTTPDGEMNGVSFYGNTIVHTGGGWGGKAEQRKPGANWGFAILLDSTPCPANNISITGNSVYGTNTAIYALSVYFNDYPSITVGSNFYYGYPGETLFVKFQPSGGTATVLTQFAIEQTNEYKNYTGKDADSVFSF